MVSERRVGLVILYQRRWHAPKLADLVARRFGDYRVRWEEGAAFIAEPGDAGNPEVCLALQDGPEVMAQNIRFAANLGGDDADALPEADTATIARCDARLVASWMPGHEVTDITLDICYLEEDVEGIAYYANNHELSAGSLRLRARHATLDDLGEPILDAELAARLHGHWRRVVDGDDGDAGDGAALTITPAGDLIYSDPDGNGGVKRILLEYRVEGDDLVTDQPSHPRPQRTPISFDGDGRLILADLGQRAVYTREAAAEAFDPDAALYALAGAALRHGVASAHAGDAIIPFLLGVEASGRKTLSRLVTDSPENARASAERIAAAFGPEIVACAYAHDGYLRAGDDRTDAIIVEASRRGRPRAITVALAYRFSEDGAPQPSGGLVTFPDAANNWLEPGGDR